MRFLFLFDKPDCHTSLKCPWRYLAACYSGRRFSCSTSYLLIYEHPGFLVILSQRGWHACWRGWTGPMWDGVCSHLCPSLSSPEQLCLSFPAYSLYHCILLRVTLSLKSCQERVVDRSQKKYHWAIPWLLQADFHLILSLGERKG